MSLDWYFYIGLIASILIGVYTFPQLIKTAKTHDTASLSRVMMIIGTIGSFFFMIDGIGILADASNIGLPKALSSGLPLLIGNVFSLCSMGAILGLKLRNMYYAKNYVKVPEKELCNNWDTYKTQIADVKQKRKEERLAAKQAKKAQVEAKKETTIVEQPKPVEEKQSSTPYTPIDDKEEIK